MKKNKKGFTLVELLATIAILGIISIIALPQINKIMQENSKRKFEKYGESIITASKLYTDSYTKDMFGNNVVGCKNIDLNTLMEKGLIEDIKIDNATCDTKNGAKARTFVEISKNKDNYKYKLSIYCEDKTKKTELYNKEFTANSCEGGNDRTGPTITVTTPSSLLSGWVGKSATTEKMTVRVDDPSGLKENAEIEYVWSKSENLTGTESTTKHNFENKRNDPSSETKISLPDGANGEYYLHVLPTNVYDSLGNISIQEWQKSQKIQIDTSAPTSPNIVVYKKIERETDECVKKFLGLWCTEYKKEIVEEKVSATTQYTPQDFPLYTRAYGSTDVGSGLDKYSYTFKETSLLTDITIENCPPALNLGAGAKCSREVTFSSIDNNVIYYYAKDKAGNTSTHSALSLSIKKDTTPPECETSGGMSSLSWTNQNVTIKGKCSDPTCAKKDWLGRCKETTTASGCADYEVTKTFTENTNANVSPGTVCDNDGNCTECGKENVQIDKSAPNAPTYSVTTDSSTGEKKIYIDATDNGSSGIDYYQCSLSGAKTDSSFKKYEGLLRASVTIDKNGSTTLSCYSVDNAGNTSPYSSQTNVYVTIIEQSGSTSGSGSSSGSSSSSGSGSGSSGSTTKPVVPSPSPSPSPAPCSSTTTSWGSWSTCDCKSGKKTRTGTKKSTINNQSCGTVSETKDCTSTCQGICSKESSTVFGGTYRNATSGNSSTEWTTGWNKAWCRANKTTCKPNPNGGYARLCVIDECKGMSAEQLNDKYGCKFAELWCTCG